MLGTSLDELMRHVGSLRAQALDVVISIFKRLCELGSTSPNAAQRLGTQVPA